LSDEESFESVVTASGIGMAEKPLSLTIGSVDGAPFQVEAAKVATGRTCIIGTSGSGKSYAVGVVCEELLRSGVPFALVDTEGEFSGLKEKYDVLLVGEDETSDIRWSGLDVGDLAKQALDIAPLVLDVSEADDPRGKVSGFLSGLYEEISLRRTPYLVIVEEADRFIPQSGEKLPVFGELARRGRKRGLGLMICTQRPSVVDKNILSQCANQLIGKLVIKNDLQSVSQFFPGNALPKQLTSLPPGEFYAMGGLSPEPARVVIRERDTSHGGSTPPLTRRTVRKFVAGAGTAELHKEDVPRVSETLGLPSTIPPEAVPGWVKRQRRFLLFGGEETILSVQPFQRELIELAVRLREGLLRKRYETKYCTIDGQSGQFVDLEGGLTFSNGLERLLGLDTEQVETLLLLRSDRELSLVDLVEKSGVSRGVLRGRINALEERRLVRESESGRSRVFRRVMEQPYPVWRQSSLELVPVEARLASSARQVKESEVREVVRGLWPDSELEGATRFYYPIYRVELALRKRHRKILVDGRTGKALKAGVPSDRGSRPSGS